MLVLVSRIERYSSRWLDGHAVRLCYFGISPHDPQGAYLGRFFKFYSGTLMGNFTVHGAVQVIRGFYMGRQYIEDLIQY